MFYNDKDFVNILKAVWYNLFSRKLPFITMLGDPNLSDVFMFSNVDVDTMLIYDDSAKYGFARVVMKNKKFLEDFYTRFGVIKTIPCVINVVDFIATLTKNKDINEVGIKMEDSYIYMSYTDNNITIWKKVADIVPRIVADMYFTIWKSGLVTSEDPYITVFTDKDFDDKDYKVITVRDINQEKPNLKSQNALAILQPGLNIITLNSYLKAIKGEVKEVTLICGYDKNSIVMNYKYDGNAVYVLGTHPSQRWFVKDKRI